MVQVDVRGGERRLDCFVLRVMVDGKGEHAGDKSDRMGDEEEGGGSVGASSGSTTQKATPLHITLAVLYFNGSSLFSIFVNKAILTGYQFQFPTTLMLIQMLVGVILLSILKLANYVHVPPLKRGQMLSVLTPTVAWIANVLIGLYALNLVNIPMFSTLRRLSMLFVMATEYFAGRRFSGKIILSVLVIVVGSVFSAAGDMSFDSLGYFLVFVNNLVTALYFNSLKRALNVLNINALQLYYYTSLCGVPLIAFAAIVSDFGSAVNAIQTRPEFLDFNFLFLLFLSALFSFSVNYSTNLTTHYTSPLTAAVSSQIKNFLQTALGMLSWGYHFSALNVTGLFTAVVGSCMYSFVRYKEAREEEARRKLDHARSSGEGTVVDVPLTRNTKAEENKTPRAKRG